MLLACNCVAHERIGLLDLQCLTTTGMLLQFCEVVNRRCLLGLDDRIVHELQL
jgi:hypothetical protein